MRVWRSLVVLVITVTLMLSTEAIPAAAQIQIPSVDVPYEVVTSLDLTRPDRNGFPYAGSYIAASTTDGRYVLAINSYGPRFSTQSVHDFSRYDIATGDEVHFSPTWNGDALDGYVADISMSDDGRHLVFTTQSSNVIFGGVGQAHAYYFDVESRQPLLVSMRWDRAHSAYPSSDIALTPDGRYAVFSSGGALTPNSGGGIAQVFRWDRLTATNVLVSETANGIAGNVAPGSLVPIAGTRPTVSDDGRFITFISYSTNLVSETLPGANEPNFPEKAYFKDLESGTVTLLTRDATGPLNVKSLQAQVTPDGSAAVYNNIPFGQPGTAWRWSRETEQRTHLLTGTEAIAFNASFRRARDNGTTLELSPGIQYRDGTILRSTIEGDPDGMLIDHVGLLDRNADWASFQHPDALGRFGPRADILTRSIPPRPQKTCGSADLAFAPGVRPLDDQVARLYQAVFGRDPDPAGLAYWIDQRVAGASMAAVATEFAASSEWDERYGADASTDEVITLLYRNVLDRSSDPEGFAFWQGSGLGVPQLIVSFSDSEENVHLTSTSPPMTSAQGAVCRLYLGVFGRAPDAEGLEFWTNRIEAGQPVASVAGEFAASPEWDQAYGSSPTPFSLVTGLYGNVFGRTADIGGVRFWVGLSHEGLSEAALLEQFVQSAEFIKSTGTAP